MKKALKRLKLVSFKTRAYKQKKLFMVEKCRYYESGSRNNKKNHGSREHDVHCLLIELFQDDPSFDFQVETEGLTGQIKFNDEGRRQNYTLDVVEMTVNSAPVKVSFYLLSFYEPF